MQFVTIMNNDKKRFVTKLKGYDNYGIDLGENEVYNIKLKKKLKPYKNQNGYHLVSLFDGKKRQIRPLHRLIYQAYYGLSIQQMDKVKTLVHKDGIKDNNYICNFDIKLRHETFGSNFKDKSYRVFKFRNPGSSKPIWIAQWDKYPNLEQLFDTYTEAKAYLELIIDGHPDP